MNANNIVAATSSQMRKTTVKIIINPLALSSPFLASLPMRVKGSEC